MDVIKPETVSDSGLEARSDEELRALIGKARTLLAQRENARKAQAIAQIKKLAKANGLTVNIKKPARRRGRPPKAAADSADTPD